VGKKITLLDEGRKSVRGARGEMAFDALTSGGGKTFGHLTETLSELGRGSCPAKKVAYGQAK